MMHYILFIFFCSVHSVHALFEHDRAAYALQVGEPEQAHALMTRLMVHHPDDAYKIYDAGVAAYKAQQYEYARSCFDAVAALSSAPGLLHEQAYFNLGNTYVAQQDLDAAITSYEKALAINPDNAHAQHNLEIVKKMKQQQEESEKQSQQKKQEQEKEQSEKNKGNNNQQDNEQRKQQGESQKQPPSDKEQKSQQEQSSRNNAADQQNPKKQKQNAEQESQQDNGSKRTEQQPKQGDNEHQQSSSEKQESTPQSNKLAHNEKPDAKKNSADKQKAQEQNQAVDQWVMNLLKEDEHNDAQLNKQIIKTTVGKELAGHHGQQCW